MAQLKSTNVVGNLSVTGNILASKIIKLGGTANQILMADGSTMNADDVGAGTVTSVGVSSSSLTVTGSPVTGAGVIKIEHPTTTATTADIYKIGKDSHGHVVIGNKITPADLGLSTVYKYKGTKTWAELKALTSAEIGDVYSITDKDPDGNTNADWACYTKVTAATGNNYATYWQSLGGKVDLSTYVQGSGTAKKIPVFTNASTLGDSAIAMTDQDTVKIDTSGHTSLTDPALHIHHYGPQTGDDYAEMMILSGLTRNPYGLRFRSHGSGTQIIQSQRIADNSECFGISLNPNGGNVAIGKQTASYKLDVNGNVGANGFIKSGSSDSYVLLAGGGAKPLSEFALGGNVTVKSGDILSIANNELSTTYSITTSAAVGNLAKGTTVNGSVKDLLDLVFGTPTTISNLTLTAAAGSFEKGTTKSLTKAVVRVGKGTAKTLDKLEIKSGSTVLASITSVVEGNNTITIPSTNITSDTTITALLTYDTNNSKTTTAKYGFFFYSYYGAVASNVSVDNITYTSLSKKNGQSSLTITMSNQCAVLAVPGTASTIKDENNFDCTGNFTKTTKTITNSLGASTSYTVFKLITPVSGTKTYKVS